ncbi:MAG: hypothetical protein RR835_10305 [Peptostreptococcaceae bacterium]
MCSQQTHVNEFSTKNLRFITIFKLLGITYLQEYKEKSKAAANENNEKIKELEKTAKDLAMSLEKTIKELDQKTVVVENQYFKLNSY